MRCHRVGLIGLGAIGTVVAQGLRDMPGVELAAVLLRPRHREAADAILPGSVARIDRPEEFGGLGLDLVVECAGQSAVHECGDAVLAGGQDLMVVSTGAFAASGCLERLTEAARRAGRRILVPAGAIAGLDGLGALKEAGLTRVVYTSAKPPCAWMGTPAETRIDLRGLTERQVFFEGSAREAALHYPKNANLAATVALAGLGLDETTVRLVADPAAAGNTGTIEAESPAGDLTVVCTGRASDNPKTSASTAYSLLHGIRSGTATFVI